MIRESDKIHHVTLRQFNTGYILRLLDELFLVFQIPILANKAK